MKNLYKTIILIFVFTSFTTILFSQAKEIDVLYLKDGKVISGKIIEKIPDKTVVIETKEGVEFYDYVDINRVEKEYIPVIESVYPTSGIVGSVVTINGSFPSQPKNCKVFFGSQQVGIDAWRSDRITIKVPDVDEKTYSVAVQMGSQRDLAQNSFTVVSPVTQQVNTTPYSPSGQSTDEYNLGGFWFNFAYVTPNGEFGETSGQNAGFAKKGFGTGYEGRVHLSENLYLPLSFQFAYLGLNIEEMRNQSSSVLSSEDEAHYLMWFTLGLGVAINLSPSAYLFGSGDYGISLIHLPDLNYESSNVKLESADTFAPGFAYSFGLTFTDAVTFGAKYFSAKPKHKVTITNTGSFSSSSMEREFEQPTKVGVFYISFSLN
ncbi:MAG: IPT/TIG domain-containing protein [Ignavibacteriales bacterium]|nr:IPT/TIG domain-containing protein [Ignavibacteriales bacterium]